jgi:hypothetical protein
MPTTPPIKAIHAAATEATPPQQKRIGLEALCWEARYAATNWQAAAPYAQTIAIIKITNPPTARAWARVASLAVHVESEDAATTEKSSVAHTPLRQLLTRPPVITEPCATCELQ